MIRKGGKGAKRSLLKWLSRLLLYVETLTPHQMRASNLKLRQLPTSSFWLLLSDPEMLQSGHFHLRGTKNHYVFASSASPLLLWLTYERLVGHARTHYPRCPLFQSALTCKHTLLVLGHACPFGVTRSVSLFINKAVTSERRISQSEGRKPPRRTWHGWSLLTAEKHSLLFGIH